MSFSALWSGLLPPTSPQMSLMEITIGKIAGKKASMSVVRYLGRSAGLRSCECGSVDSCHGPKRAAHLQNAAAAHREGRHCEKSKDDCQRKVAGATERFRAFLEK